MSKQVATCNVCQRLMNGTGCVGHLEIDKEKFPRIPNVEGVNCHDCGAKPGLLHHWKCDNETCPKCHLQILDCDCEGKYEIVTEGTSIPSYKNEKYVKKYLNKQSNNDLLMRCILPSIEKEWKGIFVKELIKRGVSPAMQFVNPYDKFPSDALFRHLRKQKDQDVQFLIKDVLDKRERTCIEAESKLPLYIVSNDTNENDFDLQFCLEKMPRIELLKNLGLCLDYEAFPFVLAIIDKEGNVDDFTEGIEI